MLISGSFEELTRAQRNFKFGTCGGSIHAGGLHTHNLYGIQRIYLVNSVITNLVVTVTNVIHRMKHKTLDHPRLYHDEIAAPFPSS